MIFNFNARYTFILFLLIVPCYIFAQTKDTVTNKNNWLNQTVISAARYEQSIKRMVVSTEVIQPYLIRNRNTTMMDKLLDNIPSVHVTDGQVNIRNGSGWTYGIGSRVMVLVDDMPFLTGDAGQVKWNFIPIENVQQVEVIKGASSVLYGSSALSGIVHFRTEMAKTKPVTRFQMHSGIFSQPKNSSLVWNPNTLIQYGFTGFHSFRKEKSAFAFSMDYFKDQGYRMGENDHRLRLTARTEFSTKGKAKYGLNAGALLTDGGSFLLWESFEKGYTALDSQTTSTLSKNIYLDPYLTFYTGTTKHNIRARWLYINNDITNADPANNQDNASHNLFSEYQAMHYFQQIGLVATAGALAQLSETNSPLYQGYQKSSNLAAFVQFDKAFGKRLNATAGARFEYFQINGKGESKPVFRAGLNYELARASFLRASFGQGFRFPAIAERYVQTSVGLLNVFPNPSLQAETGWNAEIGIKQGFGKNKLRGYIDAAYFFTRYQNMIDFNLGVWKPIADPFNPFPSFGFMSINTGETQLSGFDFSMGAELNYAKYKLNFLAGYTYTMPIMLNIDEVYAIDSLGQPLSFRSTRSDSTNILKYRFRHLVRADMQLSVKKWQAGIGLRYNSAMENIDAAFVSIPLNLFITGIDKGRQLSAKGKVIADVRISYQVTNYLKLSLIVNNVFNAELMTRPADLRPPRLTMIQFSFAF
jgi:iron complex outermembrane receptor protein